VLFVEHNLLTYTELMKIIFYKRPLSIDELESIRSYIKSRNNEVGSECIFLPLQEIDNIIEILYKEISETILNAELDSLREKILCWYKDINTNVDVKMNTDNFS